MKPFKLLTILLLLIIIIACGNSSKKKSEASANLDAEISGTSESCLDDLVRDNLIEQMISKSEIAEIVGKPENKITVKDNKINTTKYSTINYNWKTRTSG